MSEHKAVFAARGDALPSEHQLVIPYSFWHFGIAFVEGTWETTPELIPQAKPPILGDADRSFAFDPTVPRAIRNCARPQETNLLDTNRTESMEVHISVIENRPDSFEAS